MKFTYNQLRTITPQLKYLRYINRPYENCPRFRHSLEISDKILPVDGVKRKRSINMRPADENKPILTKHSNGILKNDVIRNFSFFPRKNLNFPIKCRLKCNETGQQVAEPYIAKKPSRVKLNPISKDFTKRVDDTYHKLHGKIFKSYPITDCTNPDFNKTTHASFDAPNALTDYLKEKGQCPQIFKGDFEKIPYKKRILKTKEAKQSDIGCLNEIGEERTEFQKVVIPDKNLSNTTSKHLMYKLKSKRLIKSSGFIDDDLLQETLCKLRARSPIRNATIRKMTFTNRHSEKTELSNYDKSVEKKFGVQDTSKTFLTTERNFRGTSEVNEKEILEEKASSHCKQDLNDSNHKMNKTHTFESSINPVEIDEHEEDSKLVTNILTNEGTCDQNVGTIENKKNKKIRKKPTNKLHKPKNGIRRRKRKSKFWFSRLPMEPNIRGSVIFANGNAQILDDPCKILSVNFCNSDDVLLNLRKTEMSKNARYVEQDTNEEELDLKFEKINEKNRINEQNIKNVKLTNVEKTRDSHNTGTISRQKKISSLDKATNSYIITVIPANAPKSAKTQTRQGGNRRMVNRSESGQRRSSSCKLHVTMSNLLDDSSKSPHRLPKSSNISSTSAHVVQGMEETEGSFVRIKEVSTITEDRNRQKKMSLRISPSVNSLHRRRVRKSVHGVSRAVTQKPAHLNILESKPFNPITTTWKNAGQNYQQSRRKSTGKSVPSWKSRCDCDEPCPYHKKSGNPMAFPADHDYEERISDEMLRKWSAWQCPIDKDAPCPITNDDLKNGVPCKRPPSASALNRCNYDECKNRLRCRRPITKCRNIPLKNKPAGPGQ